MPNLKAILPDPKKKLLEIVVGLPFAAIIGFTMMGEKKAVAKAMKHFFPEDEKPEETAEEN